MEGTAILIIVGILVIAYVIKSVNDVKNEVEEEKSYEIYSRVAERVEKAEQRKRQKERDAKIQEQERSKSERLRRQHERERESQKKKIAEAEFHRKAEEQIARIFGFRLHHHKEEHLNKLKNELDKAIEQRRKVDIIYSNDAGNDLYLQTISNIKYPSYYSIYSDSCFTAYCHQDYKEKKYKLTRIGSVNIVSEKKALSDS